jgi:hypothetical protein
VIEHARRVLRRRYAVPQGARLSSTVRPMRQTGVGRGSGPGDAAPPSGPVPVDPPGPGAARPARAPTPSNPSARYQLGRPGPNVARSPRPEAARSAARADAASPPSSCLMPSSVALSTNRRPRRAKFLSYASVRRHSARIQPGKGLGGVSDASAGGWRVLSATHGSIRQECDAAPRRRASPSGLVGRNSSAATRRPQLGGRNSRASAPDHHVPGCDEGAEDDQ